MSVRQYAYAVGILVFCMASLASSIRTTVSDSGCGEAAKELRGTGCHEAKLHPAPVNLVANEGEVKESEEEKKKLKIDETGSPSNHDIKKIDKAVRKNKHSATGKMYALPLGVRLCIVAVILLIPLVIICAFMYKTPAEDLSSSIYVKTALHCGFSFTVGWLNCIMLLRYRVFATMMVGNTILMGVAFVCNGFGFHKATVEQGYWWMGQRAQVLCPAQFDSAGHYAIMIFLFLLGSFIQGILFKKYGWTSKHFAPIVAAGMITVEMFEYFQVIPDSKWDVYLLSPIFGMFVSISAHCGVGSVPWAATGHMVGMGFKLASWCTDFKPADLQSVIVNVCLWTSFVLGIMAGALFHSNRTVMLNALSLQCLIVINGMIFKSSPSKAKGPELESDCDGVQAAAKLPLGDSPWCPGSSDEQRNYSTM